MSARKKIDSVKTVKEFVRWVQDLDVRIPARAEPSLLYRGLANACWPVESAASRRVKEPGVTQDISGELKKYTEQLLDTAHMRDFRVHEGRVLSDLELLARLQHFGAATCLIDFTHNPLVALWFACRKKLKKDGMVVVLILNQTDTSTLALNRRVKLQRPFDAVVPAELQEKINYFLDAEISRTWAPTPRGDRVIAQQSVFVFGEAEINNRHYAKIRVLSSAKESILSVLREKFGVSEESLFSDFTGFALVHAHNERYTGYSVNDCDYIASWLYHDNQKEKAMQYCNQAIAKKPQHVDALFLRGKCNMDLGNHQKAFADFSEVITIDDKHILSFVFRGLINHIHSPNLGKALDDYTRVIELAPKSVYGYHQRGCVKAEMEKHPDAIADFTSAIALDPKNADIYRDRAKSHRALGNETEAQADEKKALELDRELQEIRLAQNAPQ